jgi:hypothetical protein
MLQIRECGCSSGISECGCVGDIVILRERNCIIFRVTYPRGCDWVVEIGGEFDGAKTTSTGTPSASPAACTIAPTAAIGGRDRIIQRSDHALERCGSHSGHFGRSDLDHNVNIERNRQTK